MTKRVFRSQMIVPRSARRYELTSRCLPSARIARCVKKGSREPERAPTQPLSQQPQDLDRRVKEMSRQLEWYMLGTTALLAAFVCTQSNAWVWQSWWWIFSGFVAFVVLVRISEIVSQPAEVVWDRIQGRTGFNEFPRRASL